MKLVNRLKPILHIDMDDTIVEYSPAIESARLKNPGIQYPQSQLDFFRNLKPMPGALEAVRELETHQDVWILSSPSPLNPLSYTEKRIWVHEHLGDGYIERLILTMNKGLVKGKFLIDDWKEGQGQEHFEGILIHYGSKSFPEWEAIKQYLLALIRSSSTVQ